MAFMQEINEAIELGVAGFQAFVQKKQQVDADFLEQCFWLPDASQQTVLNYLIHRYLTSTSPVPVTEESAPEESTPDLMPMIEYVIGLSSNKNVGEPLHQAIETGKIDLVLHLLALDEQRVELMRAHPAETKKKRRENNGGFDLDRRDREGRTLLSLALANKHPALLAALLQAGANVHSATRIGASRIPLQPIHQAVALDFADGVRLLTAHQAHLANPCAITQDTPVLRAAHLGTINALEALLEQPVEQLHLDAERFSTVNGLSVKQNAMERLCDRINEGSDQEDALRGIAMLLCRGAEPPRNESMRALLSNHRITLLKAIQRYLDQKPELVDAFVQRCHLTESALHNIIYAQRSWGNTFRHLFGVPGEEAFLVEELVIRKYTKNPQEIATRLPTVAEHISTETDPLKLYALFVKRYQEAYGDQLITNPWSTMRWMIADGQCDWAKIKRYAETNPKSRSAIIYNELINPMPKLHADVDVSGDEPLADLELGL